MHINFEQVTVHDIDTIFHWLAQPHVQEFWDNTQAHKDDILNFVHGRVNPSSYVDGKYVYWIARENKYPFAMLMTIQETHEGSDVEQVKKDQFSKTGNTYGMDYMIGDPDYLGKGYGAQTLIDFVDFFVHNIDPRTGAFLIDPAADNPKAKHVYMKAGFEHVGDFIMTGDCSGSGKKHHLLVRRL